MQHGVNQLLNASLVGHLPVVRLLCNAGSGEDDDAALQNAGAAGALLQLR